MLAMALRDWFIALIWLLLIGIVCYPATPLQSHALLPRQMRAIQG